MSANSPIDWVISIGWGLSPHASSFNFYLLLWKNCKVYLILVKMSPGNLLAIIPADLLDTLVLHNRARWCSCDEVVLVADCWEDKQWKDNISPWLANCIHNCDQFSSFWWCYWANLLSSVLSHHLFWTVHSRAPRFIAVVVYVFRLE